MAQRQRLSIKQQLFVEHYLRTRNGVKSAELAGYKGTYGTLNSIAVENLQKPLIRQAIDKRLEPFILSANQVLSGLSAIAEADIAEVFEADGSFNLDLAKERGVSKLIKSISFDKDTGKVTKVEVYSAHEGFRDLARHHGLMPTAIKLITPDEADKVIDDAAKTYGLPLGTEDHLDNQPS